MRVYLAGPMTGLPNLNFDEFAKYANQLRLDGNDVYNPAAANLEGMPLGRIMSHVLVQLCESEAIALIPGWRKSGGAKVEYLLAVYLGLKIIRL